mmetsp:Transcript_9472/g.41466  ORF Transcript_9472/g.41466 Transcript_9472/m.41466 type:complete len:429 (-) Transcript_9472:637-1923(-)
MNCARKLAASAASATASLGGFLFPCLETGCSPLSSVALTARFQIRLYPAATAATAATASTPATAPTDPKGLPLQLRPAPPCLNHRLAARGRVEWLTHLHRHINLLREDPVLLGNQIGHLAGSARPRGAPGPVNVVYGVHGEIKVYHVVNLAPLAAAEIQPARGEVGAHHHHRGSVRVAALHKFAHALLPFFRGHVAVVHDHRQLCLVQRKLNSLAAGHSVAKHHGFLAGPEVPADDLLHDGHLVYAPWAVNEPVPQVRRGLVQARGVDPLKVRELRADHLCNLLRHCRRHDDALLPLGVLLKRTKKPANFVAEPSLEERVSLVEDHVRDVGEEQVTLFAVLDDAAGGAHHNVERPVEHLPLRRELLAADDELARELAVVRHSLGDRADLLGELARGADDEHPRPLGLGPRARLALRILHLLDHRQEIR